MRNSLVTVRLCGCLVTVTPNKMNADFCKRHKAMSLASPVGDKEVLDGLCEAFALEHGRNNWWVQQRGETHQLIEEAESKRPQELAGTALPTPPDPVE